MRTPLRKSVGSLVLAAAALFGLACNETTTPNRARGVRLSNAGAYTHLAGGGLSGTLTWLYGGGSIAGATVTCQGKSTTSSNDGAYSLTGLMSGKATVTVYWPSLDYQEFAVELKPGPNTADLKVGP